MLLLLLGMPQPCVGSEPPAVAQESAAPAAAKVDAAKKIDTAKAGTAKADTSDTKFVRLRRDQDQQAVALETSVTRYIPADGQRAGLCVDLIGAIHVGEQQYYEELNRLFVDYDGVLFELVAPEGTRIPRGGRQGGGSPISFLQKMLKDTLALEFQLEHVDYTKGNMIHADMTPEEFSASMKKRGESFFKMFFKMMGQAMAMQSKNTNSISDMQLIVALLSRDRAFQLKRLMAQQMQDVETHLAMLYGAEGSTIITERNKKALAVLGREIKNGEKKLAIFYGAGHLPDFELRLKKEFGLRLESQRWVEAWSLTRADSQGPAAGDRVRRK